MIKRKAQIPNSNEKPYTIEELTKPPIPYRINKQMTDRAALLKKVIAPYLKEENSNETKST